MGWNTAAGVKVYIGTTASATNQTEFEADSYDEVGTVEDAGEFGDAFNSVTFESLGDGRTQKRKGTADAGDMNLVMAFDGTDAGQQALESALRDTGPDDYNFKVELNDTPSGGTSPTTFYFRGKVMQRRIQVGTVNNVVRASVVFAINSQPLRVAAA